MCLSLVEQLTYRFLRQIRNSPWKYEEEKNTVFYFYDELYAISILSFIGGFIGAVGYIKCSVFTGNMTGNVVVVGTAVQVFDGFPSRAIALLSFIVGGIYGFFYAAYLKSQKHSIHTIGMFLYASEIVLLLVSFALGMVYDSEIIENGKSPLDWRLLLVTTFLGLAMGVHNAASKETIPNVPATTYMSSTVVSESATITQVLLWLLVKYNYLSVSSEGEGSKEDEEAVVEEGMDAKEKKAKADEKKRKEKQEKIEARFYEAVDKWVVVTRPLVIFGIGAMVGATLAIRIAYYSLLLVCILLLTLTFDIFFCWVIDRQERKLVPSGNTKEEEEEEVKRTEKDQEIERIEKGDQESVVGSGGNLEMVQMTEERPPPLRRRASSVGALPKRPSIRRSASLPSNYVALPNLDLEEFDDDDENTLNHAIPI